MEAVMNASDLTAPDGLWSQPTVTAVRSPKLGRHLLGRMGQGAVVLWLAYTVIEHRPLELCVRS
jgi:hypothetical protein